MAMLSIITLVLLSGNVATFTYMCYHTHYKIQIKSHPTRRLL
jgi:hypothetical protein